MPRLFEIPQTPAGISPAQAPPAPESIELARPLGAHADAFPPVPRPANNRRDRTLWCFPSAPRTVLALARRPRPPAVANKECTAGKGKRQSETCREASSWAFKRSYFNDAQKFLRLLRQELLEFLEVLSLCFLPRIPGARVEREQMKIGRVVLRVELQRPPNLLFCLRVVFLHQVILAQLRECIHVIWFAFQSKFQFVVSFLKPSFLQCDRTKVVMCRRRGFGSLGSFLQSGNRCLIILRPEKSCTQRQLSSRILRPQPQVLLKIRHSLPGVMPESRTHPHRIVVVRIFRLDLHIFLEGIPRFRDEAQVHAHQPKIVVYARVLRLQISRVRQVSQRALVISLIARDPR